MIEFEVHFPPSGNSRNGINWSQKRVFNDPKYKRYKRDAYYLLKQQKVRGVMGRVEVHLHVYQPLEYTLDEDNIKKSLYDTLKFAGIIEDDIFIKSGAYSEDMERVKGGLILGRIRVAPERKKWWAWGI